MAISGNVQIAVARKQHTVTSGEHDALHKAAIAAWRRPARVLSSTAAHARAMWDSLDDLRSGSWLIPAVVDRFAGTSFPPEAMVRSAESSAAKLNAAVRGGKLNDIVSAYGAAFAAVHDANNKLEAYYRSIARGGDRAVAALEVVRDGCAELVTISLAIAAAGGSVAVTSAASAAGGSYQELLKQIQASQTERDFSPMQAGSMVLLQGAINGFTMSLIKLEFVNAALSNAAAGLASKSLASFGQNLTEQLLAKMYKAGLDQIIKDSVKQLVESCAGATKPITFNEAVTAVARDAVQKFALRAFFGDLDKILADAPGAVGERLAGGLLAGVDKTVIKKILRSGGEKIIEARLKKIMPDLIVGLGDDPKQLNKLLDDAAKRLAKDPKLKPELLNLQK